VNGTNHCDKYIKQKEKLQNNNDKINTLINDCEEIQNFINDKQNKFVDIIENYKNKLESINRSINNIISFIFNKKEEFIKKNENIIDDINNLDIDFTLLDDINKTKQELENKKLLILEENKKIQNFLSKELISDKNDKIYNYENNMELMEHCFGGTDMCSNMGCNVSCPINTNDSDDVIENCYYKEGEEKDFIENHRFIYKNVYGEVLKNNPKIYY